MAHYVNESKLAHMRLSTRKPAISFCGGELCAVQNHTHSPAYSVRACIRAQHTILEHENGTKQVNGGHGNATTQKERPSVQAALKAASLFPEHREQCWCRFLHGGLRTEAHRLSLCFTFFALQT